MDIEQKLKRWVLTRIPLRRFERYMIGGSCMVISRDPMILYMSDWTLRDLSLAILPVLRELRNVPVYILISLSWAHDNPRIINALKIWQEKRLARFPNVRIINLANGEAEYQALKEAGVQTAFVNHNALISPLVFRILPEVQKRFDAVYDARVSAFKRHQLAAGINSLALIAARYQTHHDEAYARRIKEILPRAYWFNDPLSADYRRMSLPEVNAALNQCRVGICLSEVEGPMFASTQYLLAGLPVVSTKSRGGRDEFFDPDYTWIVEDNAEAVASGVREMCRCPVPPEEIRRCTLQKINVHRNRLFELLDTICEDQHWREKMRGRWDSWRILPLIYSITPDVIRKRIKEAAI
jgi:hypothetical protein